MQERIFAVGDIHGCDQKLQKLMERLPYRPEHDRLVFIGDYIDRGPESAKVLDYLCRLKKENPRMIALLGNHEYLLLEYHRSNDPALIPYLRQNGLDSTVRSYHQEDGFNLQPLSFLPQEHLDFLLSLQPFWQNDEYIFVHAGLEPGVAPEDTDISVLCQVRDSFLFTTHDFGKKVIFGHTPFELPLVTPTKIGIDTGASMGNMLTAVQLPEEIFYHA